MQYVLMCLLFYEVIADGGLFVFLIGLRVLTEQNTKLTTLCLFPPPNFFLQGLGGELFLSWLNSEVREFPS